MVSFTLDGREMQVEPGTTILQAARSVEIEIPTFCYQERLSISASCRMCLVEIEGRGKLEPSCATAVAEGMVVHSHSDRVVETREDMLEILLANHPLDCPVCDKGGECELQDTVFEYGRGSSRLRDPKRVFRERDIELNQVIVFNANRCIQCQRCVRMCEEIVGDVALGTAERGLDSEITGTGNSLKDCSHCGNCIEVCPVGALMSIPYRYKARPWDMQQTETICGMCGTGCSMTVETRDGEFKRVKSRFDTGINGELLCAKGRFGFDAVGGGTRILEPMIRKNGSLAPASWAEAIGFIAAKAREARELGGRIQGQISPRQTNETAFMFQRLVRQVFSSQDIRSSSRFSGLQAEGAIAALAQTSGELAARRPLESLLKADCIFVLGSNVTDENPVSGYLIRAAMADARRRLLVASSRPCGLDGIAAAQLRLLPGREAHLLALLTAGGQEMEDPTLAGFAAAAKPVLADAESIALLVGCEFLRNAAAAETLQWIAYAVRHYAGLGKAVQLQFLFDRPNQLGLWDMGCLTGVLPGWRLGGGAAAPTDEAPGLLYVLGADPARNWPDGGPRDRGGRRAGCLVVHGPYMNATAELADVLLPAPSYGEEDGTFTSNEGRVQQVQAVKTAGYAGPVPRQVFSQIAQAMGEDLQPVAVEPVQAAIAAEVPGFGMFTADGAPEISAEAVRAPALPPLPADEVSLGQERYLVTGDGLFHSGQLSTRSECLSSLSGGPYVELNPGEGLDQAAGALSARISRKGASFTAPLKINTAFDEKTVFIPECFLAKGGNNLLADAGYPPMVTVEVSSLRD
ncbi:molybdopterin-dependent oxidoreductase [Leisingera sp. ANG59]|uniref:molybdopterin-dependent oxidoreductase n=1 Tax=Leisingera sp. ANG59 TaxID=2675221 RepID=UPI0015718E14|nr:molybdopterin-dependent oxidoreductase [Leisingera sp. ANG59]NSY41298.1 molybdopterin-dependent oxidoreductase [Leisingera sp. ANG59]